MNIDTFHDETPIKDDECHGWIDACQRELFQSKLYNFISYGYATSLSNL